MEAIELAALPGTTPLVAALVTMRARNESGLISVGDATNLRLVTAREAVVALHDGLETLADIRNAHRVTTDLVPLEPATIGRATHWIVTAAVGGALRERGSNVTNIHQDRVKLETHFGEGHDYTVTLLDIGRAVIVTRSEKFAHLLRMSVPNYVCSCSDAFHDFDLKPPMCAEHGCPVLRVVG